LLEVAELYRCRKIFAVQSHEWSRREVDVQGASSRVKTLPKNLIAHVPETNLDVVKSLDCPVITVNINSPSCPAGLGEASERARVWFTILLLPASQIVYTKSTL
jgi:hypothetical protein